MKTPATLSLQTTRRRRDAWRARVQEAVEYLLEHPNLGRRGRIRGTRELVASGTPFIVIYRVRQDAIQVLRVLHHARKWS